MQNKLQHIDDHHIPQRKETEIKTSSVDGEWISLLKTELKGKIPKDAEVKTVEQRKSDLLNSNHKKKDEVN